jgi:hypothetical protein
MLTDRPSRAPELIARYAGSLHAAAPKEHHVVSALGAWLVLAVAGQAATADPEGGDAGARRAVEAALGLPLVEAGRVAVDLLAGLPPAVAAALGLWWREDQVTDRLTAYMARLPAGATREPLTGQEQLDAWARERTFGLIDRFPSEVDPRWLLVLASAVATRVSWEQPFDVVPATELAGPGRRGGFADSVTRALRSAPYEHDVRLVRTQAAGLVGANVAGSREGLAVVSVLAAADIDRAAALAAAHEVALGLNGARIGDPVSLFDVPTGASDLGEIVEEDVIIGRDDSVERGFAILPTWHASSDLDLLDGPTGDGFRGAGRLLADLLPPGEKWLEARQAAVASYTREGFQAAAVTDIGAVLSGRRAVRRTLTLCFNRPYAAVAVTVPPAGRGDIAGIHDEASTATAGFVLPVFSAWVAEPAETPTPAQTPPGPTPPDRQSRQAETTTHPTTTHPTRSASGSLADQLRRAREARRRPRDGA